MKFKTLLILILATVPGLAIANNGLVNDFSLLDHNGTYHQLSYFGDHKAVVIATHADGSALLRDSTAAYQALNDTFAEQGVVFYLLNSLATNTRQSTAADAKEAGITLPILIDESQVVAESLGITRVGEVLIIDPSKMQLLHRGALNDVEGLRSVLQNLLANTPVDVDGTVASGGLIDYPGRKKDQAQKVSYTQDIVPILQDNCVSCHHDGGIGPWSMSNHAMVRGWSPMMREVVMTKRMPPGQIDPHVGKELLEVAGLTDREVQQLVHWIDAGAPIDGSEDPLAVLQFENPKFALGEPDLIYKVAAQSVPATGIVDYRYVPVELNLDKDVWVRAIEFIPGDRQVLHHVIAYVSSPADKSVRGRETGAARGESVGGFAPGRQPDEFRDNSGRLLTKGSNLLLQMHYTTSGKAAIDETEVAIYLHDEPPAYVMSGGVAGQRRFLVPPHAKEHKLEGEQLIERDAYLYDLTPHMHYRGKYMSYSAEYPDGTSELLLSVPKYSFNWQFNYALKEPLFLPAGTRLVARGAMDNSARNPGNPDPTKPVHFGLQTKHEMFFGFTTLRYVGDTPASVTGTEQSESTADAAGR